MRNNIPLNDIKPHTEDSTCECDPNVIFDEGEMVIVHNSFDGRENIEEGGMEDCGNSEPNSKDKEQIK